VRTVAALFLAAAVYAIVPRLTAWCGGHTFVVTENILLNSSRFFTAALIGFSLVFRAAARCRAFLSVCDINPSSFYNRSMVASRNWRAFSS
jgi:hypothetical protein